MEMLELNYGRQVPMRTLVNRVSSDLFRYGGNIGCYYIFGGYDESGAHLVQVSATGYI